MLSSEENDTTHNTRTHNLNAQSRESRESRESKRVEMGGLQLIMNNEQISDGGWMAWMKLVEGVVDEVVR